MKLPNFLIFLSVVIFLNSCGSLKDGFRNQKKNNKDEFLVEKKSPLIMPPDYNDLPIPKNENIENETDNEIQTLISKTKKEETNENLGEIKSDFEDMILEKIRNN
ncbi:DUF3035 domain-containing protein [Candidatus Pelagibacter sp.]|nr:DUF3035 domain-containing protein [Candidatus Pelagibacter sp.]